MLADTGTINVEVEARDFGLESATIAHRAGPWWKELPKRR
jgi:hypothetical protein